jgi:site-specific DNA recombinase
VGKKVVGYVRVSRVGGRDGDSFISPQLQREQIHVVARREKLDVVEVIEELDASGGDRSRPGWNRAIEMVETGEVDGVAVWNLSRFSRSVRDALDALARIEDAGGRVYSATEPFGDGAMGSFSRNMLLSLAQMERERAAEGFRQARLSAIDRGIHVAGRVPLGYVRGAGRRLEVDPKTAPVVQGAFQRRADGMGVMPVARWMRSQGVDFSPRGVRYMLSNRTYLGEVRTGHEKREEAHEALVSEAMFLRAQRKGVQSQRTGRLAGKYLLAGIATCAACGRGLRLSTGGRNRGAFYGCRGSDCLARAYARAEALDAFVLNTLESRLDLADPSQWIARPGSGREVEEAEAAVANARADLDGWLSDTRLRRTLGPDLYRERTADYVAAVGSCEAQLDRARSQTTGGYELVGRLWNTEWGHAERYEWVCRMVRRVVVSRGREPLSRRTEVELRQ